MRHRRTQAFRLPDGRLVFPFAAAVAALSGAMLQQQVRGVHYRRRTAKVVGRIRRDPGAPDVEPFVVHLGELSLGYEMKLLRDVLGLPDDSWGLISAGDFASVLFGNIEPADKVWGVHFNPSTHPFFLVRDGKILRFRED